MYFVETDTPNALEEVRELINDGADVNAENRFHDTPLHFAVRHSKEKLYVIKVLLEQGADINAKDWHGDTPLHSVFNFRDSNLEVCRLTRHLRYNVVHRFRNTLLHNAVQCREIEPGVIKLLLKHGANVNAKNWGSNTPLHFAVKFCNNGLEEIRLLIKFGANINAQNLIGDTPLHKAVLKQGKKVEAIKELWKYGADFTIKNSTDETPLLLFIRECVVKQCEGTSLCDLDCAKYLIKCTLLQMSKKSNLETVIEPTLKELLTMFDKYLLSYYQECVLEIIKMKADIIISNKSIYELVSEGYSVARENLKSEEIKIVVDHIFRQLADNAYPLLGIGFITNILNRSDLNDKLSELQLCSVFSSENGKERVVKLYSCSTLNIASYLPDKDLINLILAIYGGRKSSAVKAVDFSTFPIEINNDLKRSLNSFSGCCTKHARLESPCATGFDYSYESKALTLQRYEHD